MIHGEEALKEEYRIQKEKNVVKDTNFINMSLACKDGCFGRDVSGKYNPMYGKTGVDSIHYGKKFTEEHKAKLREARKKQAPPNPKGTKLSIDTIMKISATNRTRTIANGNRKPLSEETKTRMSISHTGVKKSKEHCENIRQALLGKPLTEERKEKIRAKAIGRILPKKLCPYCNKLSDPGNHAKHHGEKCKFKPK